MILSPNHRHLRTRNPNPKHPSQQAMSATHHRGPVVGQFNRAQAIELGEGQGRASGTRGYETAH